MSQRVFSVPQLPHGLPVMVVLHPAPAHGPKVQVVVEHCRVPAPQLPQPSTVPATHAPQQGAQAPLQHVGAPLPQVVTAWQPPLTHLPTLHCDALLSEVQSPSPQHAWQPLEQHFCEPVQLFPCEQLKGAPPQVSVVQGFPSLQTGSELPGWLQVGACLQPAAVSQV